MKKQIHILQGILILTVIFIISLLTIKVMYKINNQPVDTSYIWNISLNNIIINKDTKNCKTYIKDNTLYTEVTLEKEQDFYEFSFDIENNGTLNSHITDIKLSVDNPKNILTHKISYSDNTEINKGDIIKSNNKKTIKVRVDYPKQKEKIYEKLTLSLSLNLTLEPLE